MRHDEPIHDGNILIKSALVDEPVTAPLVWWFSEHDIDNDSGLSLSLTQWLPLAVSLALRVSVTCLCHRVASAHDGSLAMAMARTLCGATGGRSSDESASV